MRHEHFYRIRWVAALAVLVTLGATRDALGQAKGNKANGNSPFHTILTELHQTHHLLALANHDYKGHRAKAHHEVGRAIHLLQTHPHHRHHVAKTGVKLPAVHEAQQISDSQMLQAAKNLQVIMTQLAAMQSTALAHPNIVGANSNLQQAVLEIQTGLKVSPLNR